MKICSIFADSMLALLHRLQTGQEAGRSSLQNMNGFSLINSLALRSSLSSGFDYS